LDTGEADNHEYLETLKHFLAENQINLHRIIITHWHDDHIGGLANIMRNIKTNCYAIQKYQLTEKDVGSQFKYNYLEDGEVIRTEGATLKFYHTPGHTEDHLVAVLAEDNTMFSGDCILGEGTAVFENLRKYMTSLGIILSLNPSTIYPGHGPVVDDPATKVREYIGHRLKRELEIMSALPFKETEAITIAQIVDKVYEIPDALKPAAGVNVGHHLSKLEEESRIVSSGKDIDSRRYHRLT
jgi:glyoxylase-like metal-dependent hydrolase (beta-lactamase superfamily II)